MCTNTYSNKERFDKVITKIKWCSFFAPQCIFDTITYDWYVKLADILILTIAVA